MATASLNLADFASAAGEQAREIDIPLPLPGVSPENSPTLHVSNLAKFCSCFSVNEYFCEDVHRS